MESNMKHLSKKVLEISPSMTVEIDTLAKSLLGEGKTIYNLGVGEPDFETPLHIKEAAINAINKNLTRYTAPSGMPALKEAVCKKLLKENNLIYAPEQIVITSGAKHAVFNAISAIVDEGDEVLIPSPYWVTYPELVKYCGGKPVFLECGLRNGFRLKAEQILKAITPKTKAIILNSPCNPTGVAYNKEELEHFAKIIAENNLHCIADEIYEHIIYTNKQAISIASMPGMQNRTIIINGFSKAYSMTGWRIGYLAAPKCLAENVAKMQGQTVHHPSNISQYAAITALTGSFDSVIEMKDEFLQRMQIMSKTFATIKDIHFVKPDGAFYLFVDVSAYYNKQTKNNTKITNSMEFCKALLAEQSLAIVPGAAFGEDSCVRFSFTAPLSTLTSAMERFKSFINSLN